MFMRQIAQVNETVDALDERATSRSRLRHSLCRRLGLLPEVVEDFPQGRGNVVVLTLPHARVAADGALARRGLGKSERKLESAMGNRTTIMSSRLLALAERWREPDS